MFPGRPGHPPGGLPYPRSAVDEGGPRNGVLTAIEDFVAANATDPARGRTRVLRLRGRVGHRAARTSDELAAILDAVRPPSGARAARGQPGRAPRRAAITTGPRCGRSQDSSSRQQAVLERLLDSSAFGVAERLSRLRARVGIARQQSVVSKDEIRARTRAVARYPCLAASQLTLPRRQRLSARSGAVRRQERLLVFCSSSRSSSSTRASSFSELRHGDRARGLAVGLGPACAPLPALLVRRLLVSAFRSTSRPSGCAPRPRPPGR